MLTLIIAIVIVLAALLFSAWLMIRQYNADAKRSSERRRLDDIAERARTVIDQAMHSRKDRPERLREAIQMLEDIISQLSVFEIDYHRALANGTASHDRQLLRDIDMFRVSMQNARAALVMELNKTS
jgi:hypothetical protein